MIPAITISRWNKRKVMYLIERYDRTKLMRTFKETGINPDLVDKQHRIISRLQVYYSRTSYLILYYYTMCNLLYNNKCDLRVNATILIL